ncbi:MAG: hypothetical protein JW731_16180 [Bacteroidales bacterium]|nr:hypothetical protein [Bacteroidales bacterium]
MEAKISSYNSTLERISNNKFKPFLLLMFIMLVSAAMHNKILREDIISIHSWRITQTQSTIN